ncbi:MAG: metal-sensitive transcriptional regulator [Ignavibacteriaceae bacterium]|nr:metal-sensitive transcriptional regulator [Ignavibacteriaceae bacterium]
MNEIDCKKINIKINKNLNRVKGQITGIEKMILDGRDTVEIVTQIQAVRAALSSIAISILKDECNECFNKKTEADKKKQFEDLVVKFFKIS